MLTYLTDRLVNSIKWPVGFPDPFNEEPHPLAKVAAAELQRHLETQTFLEHNFGLADGQHGKATGKMFGVLVVKDKDGRLGYLSAFSGKVGNLNHHPGFVPPIFDMLKEGTFFLVGIAVINEINRRIKTIEAGNDRNKLKQDFEQTAALSAQEITYLKKQLRVNKAARKARRAEQTHTISEANKQGLETTLVRESLHDKHLLNLLMSKWARILDEKRSEVERAEAELVALKNERKERSAALQAQLFEQYSFLNKDGDEKSLRSIFSDTASGVPPSAAGECATPKLLQYAFLNGYEPIAVAEFWWGIAPQSGLRQHKQFYPACTDKCRPILRHMLEGMVIG